jgi:imidazolonepropionase-like amidohydrolase
VQVLLTEEESVGDPQFTQEEMNAIVDEAKLLGKNACAHAHGAEALNGCKSRRCCQ